MRKIFTLIIITVLITGCNKNVDIHTVINEEKYFFSIQYPIFNITKLDNKIKSDINKIEKSFTQKRNVNDELNIDFEYQIIDNRYISIAIFINTYQSINSKNIDTYLFDIKNNKFINNINAIVNDYNDLIKKINEELKNKYNIKYSYIKLDKFYIKEKYINFYIDNYFIQIPTEKIGFKLDINFDDRLIIPKIENKKKSIDISKPVIALTFDDGPSKYTNSIVEILNENDACATFFVLGSKVKYYQETLLLALKYGNEIGNHTYNHKWLTHLNETEIEEQINETQKITYKYLNYTPTSFRPAYGDISNKIKNKINMQITMWTVDTLDWKSKNKNKIIKRATKNVKDEDIILMHDIYKNTKNSIKDIIIELKKKGFQFVTVSELNEIKKLRKNNGE